ncbi:MAG: hypothetical protein ACXVA9_02670 [Bdellovibrionales bacterium]
MRALILFCLFTATGLAHAQHQGANAWLNVDYTYTDMKDPEPSMSEKGRLAGIRGDIGIGLFDNFGISVGGEYQDGNLYYDGATFSGTPVKQVTKDYLRDTRAMANFMFGPMTFSAGVAQREWFNDLVISYRRRETYNYYPIVVTVYRDGIYMKVENDIWKSGRNKSYMHDVNAAEKDVEFQQNSGTGYGAEIGYLIPTADHFSTRIFISYHRWDVKDSDVQNDNVYDLQEPKNNTVTVQLGLGLSF